MKFQLKTTINDANAAAQICAQDFNASPAN
jgi:hypothetical protein